VWEFAGQDADDPDTWYREDRPGIMVEMYHHQTQWDNRTAPRLYEAFCQVLETKRLWVSHDRVSISPPSRDPEADPKEQDLLALGTRRIAAEAGDLIIWHVALPHTAALNRGRLPRVAQYITMSRAGDDSEEARQGRIAFWRDRLSGLGRYDKEREHHERSAAVLTPLGRKLAGVDPWGQDSG
jgi:hypothetical protein